MRRECVVRRNKIKMSNNSLTNWLQVALGATATIIAIVAIIVESHRHFKRTSGCTPPKQRPSANSINQTKPTNQTTTTSNNNNNNNNSTPLSHQPSNSKHSHRPTSHQPLFRTLVLPKNQTSHLNTLPPGALIPLSLKRTMRTPPRPSIKFRVKALNTQHLLGRHLTRIIPLVRRVRGNIPKIEPLALRHFLKRALSQYSQSAFNTLPKRGDKIVLAMPGSIDSSISTRGSFHYTPHRASIPPRGTRSRWRDHRLSLPA